MCQWLSGKVTAFHVEDCGSSPGLGADARCGGAAEIEKDRVPVEEKRRRRKVKLWRRKEKSVLTENI